MMVLFDLLHYDHGKQLRLCRDGKLHVPNHTVPVQPSGDSLPVFMSNNSLGTDNLPFLHQRKRKQDLNPAAETPL